MKTISVSLTKDNPTAVLRLAPGLYRMRGFAFLSSTPDAADTAPAAVQIGGSVAVAFNLVPRAYGDADPQQRGLYGSVVEEARFETFEQPLELLDGGYAGTLQADLLVCYEELP